MRIQLLSDLHKECYLGEYWACKPNTLMVDTATDVLILAGDIVDWRHRFQLYHELQSLNKDRPDLAVVYVPGNHEFYGTKSYKFDRVMTELRALYSDCPNVQFLYNDVFVFYKNDIAYHFLGTTLWTAINDPLEKLDAPKLIYDFHETCLSVEEYHQQHQEAVAFLTDSLRAIHSHSTDAAAAGSGARTIARENRVVVVTHHAPSRASTHQRYALSRANFLFSSEVSSLAYTFEPCTWAHGHTHDPFDYRLGKTRVVCNPRGYPKERVKNDPNVSSYRPLTLEI